MWPTVYIGGMSTRDAPPGAVAGPEVLRSSPWLRSASYVVPLALMVFFVVLSMISRRVHADNEQRLLQERTDQAASTFAVRAEEIRAPLDGVAQAMMAVGDDSETFRRLADPTLEGDRISFARIALFDLDDPEPVARVGTGQLKLASLAGQVGDMLTDAGRHPFVVVDLLDEESRVLGYAVPDDERNPTHILYAERVLGEDPLVERRSDEEAFANLDYALYLEGTERPENLLSSSTRDLPLQGRRAMAEVAFGNNQLLLVASPTAELGSRLLNDLWWILLLGGGLVALGSALLLTRIDRSRERALTLAAALDAVYREQRDIAETLQLALLPQHLTAPPGCELAVRYWPAGTASLIGGDFYDVFPAEHGRWLATIGDVCGHGISAAAMTGVVRHTLRGLASHVDSPADMLRTVHRAVRDHDPTTFCTVCLLTYDPAGDGGGRLVVALGGHHHPLLRRADGTVEAIGELGTLLGVVEPSLTEASVSVDPGDVLLLYTDGLTDAPGDQGVPLDEISAVLAHSGATLDVGPLADEIRQLKRRRRPHGSTDDTAVVVLRFGAPTSDTPSTATDVVIAGEQLVEIDGELGVVGIDAESVVPR